MIVVLPDDVDLDALFDAEVDRRYRSRDVDPLAATHGKLRGRGPRPLALRMLTKTDRRYGDVPEGRPELGPCWPWIGALNADGYGVIRGDGDARGDTDGRRRAPLVLAHRAALELTLGRPIADGMFANHHCDNRRCVRPRHLYEGTATENVGDMIARGRYRGFGWTHGEAEAS